MSKTVVNTQCRARSTATPHYIEVRPRVDEFESEDAFSLSAELPGVTADGLTVKLDRQHLLIEGIRQRDEGAAVRYRRTFRVGEHIDVDKLEGNLKLGVLTLTLPKASAARAKAAV